MLKKLLKMRSKKGFTLIELIVVLVIMAILAAAAIPTMMGYVNNAKKASYLAQCRAVYLAEQSALTEARAKTQTFTWDATKLGEALTLNGSTVDAKVQDLVPEVKNGATLKYVADAHTDSVANIAAKTYEMVVTGSSLDNASITSIRYFYETGKFVELKPGDSTNVWDS